MQQLLDICNDYSVANDITFNPLKSVCLVFRPAKYKLFCPRVGYEPADLTVHPPQKPSRVGSFFFEWVSSATKIFSPKKTHFSHFFMKVILLNLIVSSLCGNIYQDL